MVVVGTSGFQCSLRDVTPIYGVAKASQDRTLCHGRAAAADPAIERRRWLASRLIDGRFGLHWSSMGVAGTTVAPLVAVAVPLLDTRLGKKCGHGWRGSGWWSN
jgi:hypothetical protein